MAHQADQRRAGELISVEPRHSFSRSLIDTDLQVIERVIATRQGPPLEVVPYRTILNVSGYHGAGIWAPRLPALRQ